MGLFGDRKRRLKETRKGLSEGRASQGLHTTGLGTALVVWDFRVLLGSDSSVCLPLDNYVYGIFLYRSIDKLYDCTCRSLCVYMSVCLYVYISIYPHIYICIHIYIYIYTHTLIHLCVHAYTIFIYVYVHLNIYVYDIYTYPFFIYSSVHMYICI